VAGTVVSMEATPGSSTLPRLISVGTDSEVTNHYEKGDIGINYVSTDFQLVDKTF